MSGSERFDLICIGSGPAGERAAVHAAAHGHSVAIVEREGLPGGAMVNTGTVASKVLRETALLCSAFRRRPLPGVDAAIDHSISFDQFLARTTLVQLEEHDRIELDLDRAGVRVIRGDARLDGPGRVLVERPDGSVRTIEAPRILIAVGSRPHRPDHVDFSHPAIVDSAGILELERMPRSLVVVGGGVIGSEYASIFAEMGVKTTLIDPRSTLMRFLDEECREVLIDQMRDAGISFQLGKQPVAVHPIGESSAAVEVESGERFEADVVLWSLGRDGNTEGLGLETASITPNERGLIEVNEQLRTHAEGIWAAGDVIGFPALASTTMQQARIAVENMFDLPVSERMTEVLPMGIYTIPAVATIGPTESELRESSREIIVGRAEYRRNARGRMLGDDRGMMKLIFERNSEQLLHATIVGEDATELIHLAMMAIAHEWRIQDFRDACFSYPSLGELFKSAAINGAGRIAVEAARQADDSRESAA